MEYSNLMGHTIVGLYSQKNMEKNYIISLFSMKTIKGITFILLIMLTRIIINKRAMMALNRSPETTVFQWL
jgi:hypothetical protein